MRPSPGGVANGLAWIGIAGLVALSFWLVMVLGFPGILLLGLLTTLVCVRAELSNDVPSWSRGVFESRMRRDPSVERRAAAEHAAAQDRSVLRLYRVYGLILIAAGLAGTIWQVWGPARGS